MVDLKSSRTTGRAGPVDSVHTEAWSACRSGCKFSVAVSGSYDFGVRVWDRKPVGRIKLFLVILRLIDTKALSCKEGGIR
jgi:hypothetical protein